MHQLCDSTAIPLTFVLRHKYLVTHSGNSLIVSTDMKKIDMSSPNALIGDLVKLDHCRLWNTSCIPPFGPAKLLNIAPAIFFPLKTCGNDDLKINASTVI